MTMEERLDILDALWSVWAGTGRALTDEDWRRPTRLGDWDLRSLWAHAAQWPFGLPLLLDRVMDAPATCPTAAELLAAFNAPGGVAHTLRAQIATSGRDAAANYPTSQLIDQFATTGPRALAAARTLGPVRVDYFGLAVLPLAEAVSIGILETTVHLLDVQRALGATPDVPSSALAHTAGLLARIPSPVDFIEAATGRAPSDLFPVLS